MDVITIIFIIAALLVAVWMFWPQDPKRKRMLETIKKIPGPLCLPVIGVSYVIFTAKSGDFFQIVDRFSRRYWPLYKVWYGSIPEVNFMEADYIETILRSSVNVKKGFIYDFLHPWLGTGLLTSTGQKWHSHRKLLTPTFHFKILEAFQEVFVEKSQVLVKKLEQELGNTKGFDVCPYVTRCTLDIICETAMGTTINAQEEFRSPYVSAIHDISELLVERTFSPWFHSDFIYFLTGRGRRFQECLNILHSFSNTMIRERKKSLKQKKETHESSAGIGKKKRKAFLDMLLDVAEDGAVLTDEEIREEVDTFMFEGHDTTSASLSWTLFLLGNHSDIQQRVFEEQISIFGDSDRLPNTQDLTEMKYLEQVIKESLRLYPSVPFISRKITEDIEIDGHFFTEGCQIVVHIYHAHRNPKYFPDPDTFNPDNFLPDKVQGRHPFAYVPFSAGSRNCIGQRFALLEEKTVLSAIVRNFRLRSLEKLSEVIPTGELILRPEKGIMMSLERR